jgi:hypothetical protein
LSFANKVGNVSDALLLMEDEEVALRGAAQVHAGTKTEHRCSFDILTLLFCMQYTELESANYCMQFFDPWI